ncbi:MAG: efflux RND transporter periplasmic adaptor subunit [Phycisphaera sp.]|nr:MAG: efflux RND transporter periplasmic adaptor subunit [Phycisphaera sp.]
MHSKALLGRIPPSTAVAAGVAIILTGVVVWTAGVSFTPATPVRVAPVVFEASAVETQEAEPGERQPAGQAIQAPGWLEAAPYYTAATALTDGVVAEVLVLEGQTVEKGQPLARLVPDDAHISLAAAEANLTSAQAELAVAQANLRAAETDWNNPIERERAVAATKAALAETEANLTQLPAVTETQRAMAKQLQAELDRASRAQRGGAANELEVIVLTQRVAGQLATVTATEQRQAILEAQRDRLRAEVHAAGRNFELRIDEQRSLDLSRAHEQRARAAVAMAQAKLDEAQLRVDRLTITAPITGAVQKRLKVPGDKIMLAMDEAHSAHVVHLYDPAKLQVRVDVPLADARHMFEGQRCEVIVEVLPDQTFEGVVDRITYEADLQKNTLQAKVRVIDPSPLLRPEMLTRVKFLPRGGGGQEAPALGDTAMLVPSSAIDNGRVWVVRSRRGDTGKAFAQGIEIIEDLGEYARVRGKLRSGDLLALNATNLNDGARVRISTDSKDGTP